MKIIVIGANHAGTAASNTILDYFKDNEVTIYDRNNNISFLGCGMALWIGEQISTSDGLFYCNKNVFEEKGAKVHMESEVLSVDEDKKTVKVRLKDGSEIEDSYDKLIIATGSRPRSNKLPGEDLENIEVAKLFQDAKKVKAIGEREDIKNVVVVGSGYIGVELAEAFQRIGKNTTLVTRDSKILENYFDHEFSKPLEDAMSENGIKLVYNEDVVEFKGEDGKVKSVVTNKGEYEADLVINSIGFVPNVYLCEDLKRHERSGAYLVDKHFRTSNEDIYAIGDCATIYYKPSDAQEYVALATNAVRSGIVAALNACGVDLASPGVQGSSGMQIYGHKIVMTGMSVDLAKKYGIEVEYTDFEDLQKPAFMEDVPNAQVKIRIIYRKDDRRIIGAQLGSTYDVSMGIHMFSLAIQKDVTIDELALTDIFFMPHFNQPYNYITMAAVKAVLG